MPTRSTYNQPLTSSSNHQIIPGNSSSQAPMTSSSNTDITSYVGRTLTINQHQVIVEDILGQGGFAFVFLVRAFNQQRYALKRMYVNNERDLVVCQREIAILKEFSTHANIVKYVDSSIQRLSPPSQATAPRRHPANNDDDDDDLEEDAIYEILLLTEYCANGALTVSGRTRTIEKYTTKNGSSVSDSPERAAHQWRVIERASNLAHIRRRLQCRQRLPPSSTPTAPASRRQTREHSHRLTPVVSSLRFRFGHHAATVSKQ